MKENINNNQKNHIADQNHKGSQIPVFDAPEGSSMVAEIFTRIDDECVKPRSKWYFICKNELFWGLGLFSVIIGSISVAASIFAISYIELDYYTVTHDSLISFLIDTMPIMWVLCFIAFFALGYMQIRNTKKGYRYSFFLIVGCTFILSVAGGGVLHAYGFGALLEKTIENRIPFHESAPMGREQIWLKAERGVIAGKVVYIEQDNSSFVLEDWSGKVWLMNATDLMDMDIEILNENDFVRVIGLPTKLARDENARNSMHACFILPWNNLDQGEIGAMPSTQLANNIDFQNNYVPMNSDVIKSERNLEDLRSKECKGVRPYQLMQKLRAEAQ